MNELVQENQRQRKLAIAAGIVFCLVPLLVNKWTLEAWFPMYVGRSLSWRTNLLLIAAAVALVAEGVRLLRGGILHLCEKAAFLAVFAAMILPYGLYLYRQRDIGNITELVYGEMLSFIPFAVIILFWPRKGFLLAFAVQSLVCFVEMFYVYYYGALPGISFVYVLLESNAFESHGFACDYLATVPVAAYWIVCGALFWWLARLSRSLDRAIMRRFALVVAALLIVPMALGNTRRIVPRYNFFMKCAIGYADYSRVRRQSQTAVELSMAAVPELVFEIERPPRELHVLIIGESSDRDHMSIYGYDRQTTPLLDAMTGLYAFSDVISPYTNTIPNMQAMLTFRNYESPRLTAEHGFMIPYLQAAGYRTCWISNQTPLGRNETLTTIMAQSCDETYFVNYNQSFNQASYDEAIFEPLQEVLDQDVDRRYVFIHLMGLHSPFRLRYPDEFDVFLGSHKGKTDRQSGIINRYHNAMLYNDFIVSRIIEKIAETGSYASVLYVSDHGLEVHEKRDFHGHSAEGGLEVPFILWLSSDFKQHRPEMVGRLDQYLSRKYMIDDLIYSVFDLLGMRFGGFDPGRSIFSPEFRPRKRIVHTFEQEQGRDYDSVRRSR